MYFSEHDCGAGGGGVGGSGGGGMMTYSLVSLSNPVIVSPIRGYLFPNIPTHIFPEPEQVAYKILDDTLKVKKSPAP